MSVEQNIKNNSFLITGGAGFIGSNLVGYLLENGAKKVRVLDNLATGKLENIQEFKSNPRFEFLQGDISNLEDCKKACIGIDLVSHQAALGSVPRSINDPITTNVVNISGFLNMLVAVRDAGIKKMVYAASSSTYGDSPVLPKKEENIGMPLSPYAVTKYTNELYAHVFALNYGMDIIGLRYFNVFGPKQDPFGAYAAVIPLFMKAAINHVAPTINGKGLQSRDFTYVQNAVQANVKGLFSDCQGHEVVNVACAEQTDLNQLWDYIQEIAKIELAANHGPARVGDVEHSLADLTKAKSTIGYSPDIKIKEGLKLAYEFYKTN